MPADPPPIAEREGSALRRVCVFCGSAHGDDPVFTEAARALGAEMARRGVGLVYGGGAVGLMGEVADAALAAGGEVIGVIPRRLEEREVGHRALTELHVVDTMHERKALMAGYADAFIAMPGGIGTLEELFEAWTWTQLGYHVKPVGLLNVAGFYDDLLVFLQQVTAKGFLRRSQLDLLRVADTPAGALDAVAPK